MPIYAVKKYFASDVNTPFFLVTGDAQYSVIKDQLVELGIAYVKVSDFCSQDDKLPDIDRLLEHLKAVNSMHDGGHFVVIGLGEYLALCGEDEAISTLSLLKDMNIGTKKVIILLRGVTESVNILQVNDSRFDDRMVYITKPAASDVVITSVSQRAGPSVFSSYKKLLIALENGGIGTLAVNTAVKLDNSLYTVRKIDTAYDGVKYAISGLSLSQSYGNSEQWAELLAELSENVNLDSVLEKYSLQKNLEALFGEYITGTAFKNWLYFIALKQMREKLQNGYLQFVLNRTDRFDDFKINVLNAIVGVGRTDKRFGEYYRDRKMLMGKFTESDIANFVVENRRDVSESIYRLTDTTKAEREEIIAWVTQNGFIPQIADTYPALGDYMRKYVFNCGELSELLTSYFIDYKRQKLTNKLEDYHLALVGDLAQSRIYNRLPTRDESIDSFDKTETHLYWLDALGVEYLAFISEQCRNRGLSLSVKIARAELPTITSMNSWFFTEWNGNGRKESDKHLDEIKHKAEGGYNFVDNQLPIHLAEELSVITKVIEKAATELALRHCRSFLLVSDHGASRLAVIKKQEEKYETDTKGDYSGRCCKHFEPYDLPFAAEENGYLVLADYGRFKGSRAASVEVHGGASLEEVVIPIIEIKLKDTNVKVELVDSVVTASFRRSAEITLYSKSILKSVTAVVNGKRYVAVQTDGNHFKAYLTDIKRAGEYTAEVYAGNDLIDRLTIKVQNESGKKNDAFDDLF